MRQFSQQESVSGPVIAAIDLGTNSCRLLIAKVEGPSFRIIDSFSRVVRLGEGVQSTSLLTDAAIERTLEALRICKNKIKHNQATIIRAVATEACRLAENREKLTALILNELGIHLEIITPEEEARLALAGCAGILNPRIPYALAFDIGGGSTEVMWLRIREPRRLHRRRYPIIDLVDCISLPCGVVTLSDQYKDKRKQREIAEEVIHFVQQEIQEFSERNSIPRYLSAHEVQMIGTSGTVTTLTAMSLNLARYDRRAIDGVYLETALAQRIGDQIFSMSHEEREKHPCIGMGRADLVIMGTAILQGFLKVWPVEKLRVADRGVREGILMEIVKSIYPRRNIYPKLTRR